MSQHPESILFFDGLCGLCDHLVQFLLKHDREGRIFFAPIQSDFARTLLTQKGVPPEELAELSTVYFLNQGALTRRSRAIFGVLGCLPAPWSFLEWLRIFPAFLTDPAYRWVSRIRYRVFGRLDQCRIPSPEEKRRFLS